ncbi:DUF1746-domain-containing protein [Astrocystis sublimbata]|nr:DUF1746-domain-containing protein [Astrocystis sublimbata]
MNNDPSPTLPADQPSLPTHHRGADNFNFARGHRQSAARAASAAGPPRRQDDAAAPKSPSISPSAKEGLAMKLRFLRSLTHNLDTLVYAELSVLYYMDCSFFRLAIRWMAQQLFISPKDDDNRLIVPSYHVFAVFAPNLFCILLHLIYSPAEAGEASRGYLHGGILVDFIGQAAPSTRFTLILLDLIVLAIQCLMLTVNIEKERIRNVTNPPRVVAGATGLAIARPPTTQDHDAEERGVLRDGPQMDDLNETVDVEMRSMGNRDGDGGSDGEGEEGSRLLGQSEAQRTRQSGDLREVLRSGNAIIGNFHVPQALQSALLLNTESSTPESAAAYALQHVGYNATLVALAAQRRARLTAPQPRPHI